MRKIAILWMMVCLAGVMILSGCSGKKGGGSLTSTEAALNYQVEDYVKLGDYKGLSAQYPTAEVTDEDVEWSIQELLNENSEYSEVTDRAAQEGDSVNFDFVGTWNGEEFDGGSGEDNEIVLGEGEFLEEFEENLIGKNSGETFTFQMTFPEDYDETLGGEEVEFAVTVNSISQITVPEYNDEFVASVTDYKTIAEYEASVREELLETAKKEAITYAAEDILTQAIENATIDGYPQAVYDACYADVIENYQFWAQLYGMEYEEFMEEYLSDEDIEEETISSVNEVLVVRAIAEAEGLQMTDENYTAEAEALLEDYGYETLEEFEADYGQTSIVNMLLRERVLGFLFESGNVEEVSAEEYYGEDEYYEEDEEE